MFAHHHTSFRKRIANEVGPGKMAWGAKKGVDDLISRLEASDPALTSIHIFQGRQFGSADAVRLAKSICSNTSLTELYASGHELDTEAVQQFADMLAKNHTIKVLCLGNASFGDASTAILAAGLPASSSLTQLDLENKAVGREGAAALWQALSKGAPLETLLLARNPITDAGMLNISTALTATKLTHLDLRDCGITVQGVEVLAEAVSHSGTLRTLRLDENSLGPEGGRALAKALKDNTALHELHLSRTGIADEGFAAIVQASNSSRLEILEACSCSIGPEGATSLAEALRAGSSLLVAKLRDNHIGDEGADVLGKALAAGARLHDLDLANNQLGKGAVQLLHGPSQLRKLGLHGASLGSDGAIQLANALAMSSFTALLDMELSACGIGTRGLSRLFDVLQASAAPALEVLLLAGNPGVDDVDFEMHVEVLLGARPDLDVVWRGAESTAPPTAVDGGPPVDAPVVSNVHGEL